MMLNDDYDKSTSDREVFFDSAVNLDSVQNMTIEDEIRGHNEKFLINSFNDSFLEIVCFVVKPGDDYHVNSMGKQSSILTDPLSEMMNSIENDKDFLN